MEQKMYHTAGAVFPTALSSFKSCLVTISFAVSRLSRCVGLYQVRCASLSYHLFI